MIKKILGTIFLTVLFFVFFNSDAFACAVATAGNQPYITGTDITGAVINRIAGTDYALATNPPNCSITPNPVNDGTNGAFIMNCNDAGSYVIVATNGVETCAWPFTVVAPPTMCIASTTGTQPFDVNTDFHAGFAFGQPNTLYCAVESPDNCSINPTCILSDGNGTPTGLFTINCSLAGTYALAMASANDQCLSTTFTVSAQSSCIVATVGTQPYPIGSQITGAVIDALPNTDYALAVSPPNCNIFPNPVHTDADGNRSFTMDCSRSGNYTLVARESGGATCAWPFSVGDAETSPRPIISRPALSPQCGTGAINTAIGCIAVSDKNAFLVFILKWALGIAGGIAMILIVVSGFMIITSSGDPKRLQAGKELLTAALTGLILLIMSVFILDILGVRILRLPGF